MPNDHRLTPLSSGDVKIGNILKLKSGGPRMTVEAVNVHYHGEPKHATKVSREEFLMRGLRGQTPEPTVDEAKTTISLVWFTETADKGWVLSRDEIRLSLLDSEV